MQVITAAIALALTAGGGTAATQDSSFPGARNQAIRLVPRLAQSQNSADQTERFSRKVRIGRDGRFSINNIAGDVVITAGSGDEVSIEAVKRTRGDQRALAGVTIEVDAGNGRVDVRTVYPDDRGARGSSSARFNGRFAARRTDSVWVDYTITVPASTEVAAKSVSGNVRISGVQGSTRAETVSGNVVTSSTPKLEAARSVSGEVDISDVATDRELTVMSVSGRVRGRNVKARTIELSTVSGDVSIVDAACERIDGRTVSGNIVYEGALAKNGRYELTTHSGTIRLTLPDSPGFSLSATTFSGSIRSDLPMTFGDTGPGRGRGRRGFNGGPGKSFRATFGDGSAQLTIRSFSGDVVISRR